MNKDLINKDPRKKDKGSKQRKIYENLEPGGGKMAEILIVAGETSGDIYAARVAEEIKKIIPGISLTGMGGNRLARQDQRQYIKTGQGEIGVSGGIKGINRHLEKINTLVEKAEETRPDAALLVDYSGFNMYLGRKLRKKGLPVVHYIPPTAWVWGKWRAKWLARLDIKVAAIFPQEKEIYQQAGARCEFVGHPLLDEISVPRKQRPARENLSDYLELADRGKLEKGSRVLALLPGSRDQEIDVLTRPLLEAARRLDREFSLRVVLPQNLDRDASELTEMASGYQLEVEVLANRSREVLAASDLAVVASGTATLEAVLLNCPQIIVYQTGKMIELLGKVLIRTDHIGLPNIIAGREIAPELMQDDVKGDIIYKEARKFFLSPEPIRQQLESYQEVRRKLGEPGAAERTARMVVEEAGLR